MELQAVTQSQQNIVNIYCVEHFPSELFYSATSTPWYVALSSGVLSSTSFTDGYSSTFIVFNLVSDADVRRMASMMLTIQNSTDWRNLQRMATELKISRKRAQPITILSFCDVANKPLLVCWLCFGIFNKGYQMRHHICLVLVPVHLHYW